MKIYEPEDQKTRQPDQSEGLIWLSGLLCPLCLRGPT